MKPYLPWEDCASTVQYASLCITLLREEIKVVDVDWEMTGNWALKRKKEKAEKKERKTRKTKNITRIRMYIVVGFKF